MKRRLATVLAVLVGGCEWSGGSSGSCVLGPCLPKGTYSEYEYVVIGNPALSTLGSTAIMKAGDSISLYFVRRRWLSDCGQPADTIAGGSWTVTGPAGQFGDFSGIASVTPRSGTRAVLLAKAPGSFGIRYDPVPNAAPPPYPRQDIRFCWPGVPATAVLPYYAIQVVP